MTNLALHTNSALHLMEPVPEIATHIIEPIAQQVIYHILNLIEGRTIFNNNISIYTDFTAPARYTDKDHNPILQAANRVNCTVKTNMNIGTARWEMPHDRLNKFTYTGIKVPIFLDTDTSTIMTEYHIANNITMDVTLEVTSKRWAFELLEKSYAMLNDGNPTTLHDLNYDYPIPLNTLGILYRIHQMKGLPANTFVRALEAYSNGRLCLGVNRHQFQRKEILVKQFVRQAISQIDIGTEEPTAIKAGQKTIAFQLSYTVALQFSRPQFILTEYPIVVKNQLIPEDVIFANPQKSSEYDPLTSPFFSEHHYKSMLDGEISTVKCIKLPWYDPWKPSSSSPCTKLGYQPILSVVFTLDDVENPEGTTEIDLATGLGDMHLVQDVIDNIIESGENALYYTDKYNIAVYSNEYQVDQSHLSLDGTKLIINNRDINRVYRLVVSVKEDILYGSLNSTRVLIFDIYTGRN